jgi:hypothetical protein
MPLAVPIDNASGKIAVKALPARLGAEITASDDVAFRQRASGAMFVNFASALNLPFNFR